MDMPRRLGAEFFGTDCGSAVRQTDLQKANAEGGKASCDGGHFNCAVTIGLWAGGRFKASDIF